VIQLAAKAALSMGILFLLASGLLLFAVTPGTSEFVVTIINMIMGGLMITAGIVAVRLTARRTSSHKEEQ
jgi:hypothetical protein